jgi:hypothetical protein
MWSDDLMRVTIACPEALIGDANQLARCIGLGPDDDQTYGAPVWRDAGGNAYAVASAVVSPAFIDTASSQLVAPDWGCDLAAAGRAQAAISIGAAAAPGVLAAIIGDDVQAALAALGVTMAEDAPTD